LEILGERWTLLIAHDALSGVSRFEDLHSRLGISRKTLSTRLGLLVEEGVMEKVPYQQRPARYDYRLTPKGAALSAALHASTVWGEAHAQDDGVCPPGARLCNHARPRVDAQEA
jgi:DNA-binding HxlR family transcriptional regulator